jgi:hypothetical protein
MEIKNHQKEMKGYLKESNGEEVAYEDQKVKVYQNLELKAGISEAMKEENGRILMSMSKD